MVVGYEGDRELGRHIVLVALAVSILGTFVWGCSEAMGVFAGTSGLSARVPPPQADPLVSLGAASPDEPVIERQLVAEESVEPEPEPPSTGVSADLYQLVADLRDDGIPGNAVTALWRLPEVGQAAVPFLEPALVSWDAQQRLLTAFVLRRIGGAPSDALLKVSVESLRSDLPVDVIRTLGSDTRTGATLFLAKHADRARPWLAAGLSSNDAQQRFLCAFLLARDRMAITIHELTRWMDDELRWRRSIASVSKAWESDQWESQPAPSELLRGNFESALLSLDDARQVAQSSREASKALMALDRAEQSVMKARLALWEQESGKGK